jgi:hypothetical protein
MDREGLTDSDLLRIIFPNKELWDFINEAVDGLTVCNESRVVDNVVPYSEEVVVIALLAPWARSKQEIRRSNLAPPRNAYGMCTDPDSESTNSEKQRLLPVWEVVLLFRPPALAQGLQGQKRKALKRSSDGS